MKKRWKIFWIVCAVLTAAGIILAAAGTALGGLTMLRSENDETFVESVLDSLGIRGRTTVTYQSDPDDLPELSEDGGSKDYGYVPDTPDGELVTAYDGISELNLDLGGLGVCIIPYDGDQIIVDISRLRADLRDDVNIEQNGGELELKAATRKWNTNGGSIAYISVPRGILFESIAADVKAGLLEMADIEVNELSVKVGAGQIVAESVSAESLEADCGAGQITFSGDITLGADINCDVGEVFFTTPGTVDDYDYELSCSLGEITLGERAYSGFSNKVNIDNESGRLIKAECDMGSIKIMFE